MTLRSLLGPGLLGLVMACGNAAGSETTMSADPAAALAALPDSTWSRLASRRIFFGHQSVGRNILDGVRSLLAERPALAWQVVSVGDAATLPAGGLVEENIGQNGDPMSKTRAFSARVDSGVVGSGGIALHKYCYVDFDGARDPDSVFADYQAAMAALRQRHPDVTLVHVTSPLRTDITGWKNQVKYRIGRATGRDQNIRRNHFNRRLLETYAGREPVFDLARLEATGPDGRLHHFTHRGDTVLTLAPQWSDDGGHLNTAGQRWVASRLLAFLAGLP